MKKILSLVMVVCLLGALTSCNEKGNASKGSALADSVSMAFGDLYGNGMGGQLKQDSTLNTNDVLRGMEMVLRADTSNHGLMTGIQIGMQIMQMYQGIKQQYKIDINQKLFMEHFKKAFLADSTMDQAALMQLQQQIEPLLQRASTEAKASDPVAINNKKKGEEFVAKKAKEAGYQKTASGLVYKVINEGKGENFGENDVVLVNYRGTHIDGKEFDASKEPVEFRMNQVVPGFAEMLKLMKPGMKVEAILPADIAYGPDGSGPVIGPNETLVFEIETVGVKKEEAKK